MKKYNLILVYNKEQDKILMCKREKEPYKGKYNLVGGKVDANESEIEAAYRELNEETGISCSDIELSHIMNFQYKELDNEIEVFLGILNKDVILKKELNSLYWIDKDEKFYDLDKFAGDGNIWHMVWQANKKLLK